MFTLAPRNGDIASSTIPKYCHPIEVYTHQGTEFLRQAQTQVDYLHCLVPDLRTLLGVG